MPTQRPRFDPGGLAQVSLVKESKAVANHHHSNVIYMLILWFLYMKLDVAFAGELVRKLKGKGQRSLNLKIAAGGEFHLNRNDFWPLSNRYKLYHKIRTKLFISNNSPSAMYIIHQVPSLYEDTSHQVPLRRQELTKSDCYLRD